MRNWKFIRTWTSFRLPDVDLIFLKINILSLKSGKALNSTLVTVTSTGSLSYLFPRLCYSRKYPYSPPSQPIWNFQSSFMHFFNFFGLTDPPPPPPQSPGNSNPFWGGGGKVWVLSGTVHFTAWMA